jgi:hypothetical protein
MNASLENAGGSRRRRSRECEVYQSKKGRRDGGEAGCDRHRPRRTSRRSCRRSQHLDLRGHCLGGGAAFDAASRHSAQCDGLVFGKEVQDSLGAFATILGMGIHFFFCFAWGVLFAFVWPYFRQRGYEATLVALFFAVILWIVMHGAIALVSANHPNYLDPNVIIGGFMSHFFYAVPLALVVKHLTSTADG